MNRKNTILIAVFINAGLLAVLLIAALTGSEETASPLMSDASGSLFTQEEGNPFYERSIELAVPKPAQQIVTPSSIPESSVSSLPTSPEEPLVHKIPPLAPEAAPTPVPAAPIAAAPQQTDPSFSEIVVKKGDNLEKIAKAHHITVDEIIKINHLPSSFLRVGQVLKIPSQSAIANTPKSRPNSTEKKNIESGAEYYTVKVGDNPWTIATKNHMKVEELIRLNGLNEEKARKLKPGDRLRIR
ncbi:MAG: LysM peptidoglycan-binding domain-containing protein [Chlamydiota bacterium]